MTEDDNPRKWASGEFQDPGRDWGKDITGAVLRGLGENFEGIQPKLDQYIGEHNWSAFLTIMASVKENVVEDAKKTCRYSESPNTCAQAVDGAYDQFAVRMLLDLLSELQEMKK